jgi:phage tail-like protein
MSVDHPDFRFLNYEGNWSGFELDGIDVDPDGRASLADLPSPVPLPASRSCEPPLPRGAVPIPERNAYLLCNPQSRTIELVDRESGDVLELYSGPFASPVSLAVDRDGAIYVADDGGAGLVRLWPNGALDPEFTAKVRDSGMLQAPCAVCVLESPLLETRRVYVLDRHRQAVFAFDSAGRAVTEADGSPVHAGAGALAAPDALAASPRTLYVRHRSADGASAVLAFRIGPGHPLIGEAPELASASLLGWKNGRLWVQFGSNAPVALSDTGRYRRRGALRSPAIDPGRKVTWTTAHLDLARMPSGSHVQIWSRLSDDPGGAGAEWRAAPRDSRDVHLEQQKARYCWFRVELSGDGASSPVLENLSVRFDQPGYIAHLPAVYRADGHREFLARFLSLFESENLEIEARIERLAEAFDPRAISVDSLPWLASWLAVELGERLSVEKQRAAVERAYRESATRGTPKGLRRAIEFETGVSVVLVEPVLQSSFWQLPDASANADGQPAPDAAGSRLGFTTGLPAERPDSAALGSAVLDRSRLLGDGDFGTPLFADSAHRFLVHVYRGSADAAPKRAELVEVIEREKPAHTSYRLLAIEPRFAIGVQACVGFDTVIAGPPEPTPLGEANAGVQLAGDAPGRIGVQSRVGRGLRL